MLSKAGKDGDRGEQWRIVEVSRLKRPRRLVVPRQRSVHTDRIAVSKGILAASGTRSSRDEAEQRR